VANIYQEIWDADQRSSGLRAIRESDPAVSSGHVRVVHGPASPDLRILSDVNLPADKRRTYDLVRALFNNYALAETALEVETELEREEVHDLLLAIVDSPPMLVARQYVENATGTTQTSERWYATLLELWFRRFASGGDPELSGFEHVFVGEQEAAKVQGYHFWYKYWLDDGFAREVDGNAFPGLSDDRIEYVRSEASSGQEVFPESVTLAYRWRAADYDAQAVRPLTKPKGGFFVGCSVEGLMALGTVRAHLGARAPKEAVIHGARYDLKIYRSPDERHVRTFYPVFLGPAGEEINGGTQPKPPVPPLPPAAPASVRIIAALINPQGDDPGQELVTLINVGPTPVVPDGWRLLDKNGKTFSVGDLRLMPGVAATVRLPANSVQLSNQGGKISLVDRAGELVHSVSYSRQSAARQGETLLF
jgi:poly(U)-specific endoribonuclease